MVVMYYFKYFKNLINNKETVGVQGFKRVNAMVEGSIPIWVNGLLFINIVIFSLWYKGKMRVNARWILSISKIQ